MNSTDTIGREAVKDDEVRQGLLFIPDISGFTNLVHTTDVLTGQRITFELLSAVLDQNRLGLQVAEVEGDAIFFYRFGLPPTLGSLYAQYELMKNAFDQKLMELEALEGRSLPLSLKVIAHYGPMIQFGIGGFTKLYGEVVIEAHRLLKNEVTSDSYLLISDNLQMALEGTGNEEGTKRPYPLHKLCEAYSGLRKICFSYFDFTRERYTTQLA